MLIRSQRSDKREVTINAEGGILDFIQNAEGIKVFWTSIHDPNVCECMAQYDTVDHARVALRAYAAHYENDEKVFEFPTSQSLSELEKEAAKETSDIRDFLEHIFSN